MIRAMDTKGRLIIGLSRETIEKLLASPYNATSEPQSPEDCPLVVMVYAAETDEECAQKMAAAYGGRIGEIVDNRGKG